MDAGLTFSIEPTIDEGQDIWMQFRSNIAATEVYVNEQLLFENGKVGHASQSEVTGKNLVRKRIPKSHLLEGNNT